MGDEKKEPGGLDFGDWLERFEHDQDVQNNQIGKLTENVSALASTVRALVDNQKGIFNRQNRPVQWGAIIGGFTMLGVMAGLLIGPINKQLDIQRELDILSASHREADAYNMGVHDTEIAWLKQAEERTDKRIHGERD